MTLNLQGIAGWRVFVKYITQLCYLIINIGAWMFLGNNCTMLLSSRDVKSAHKYTFHISRCGLFKKSSLQLRRFSTSVPQNTSWMRVLPHPCEKIALPAFWYDAELTVKLFCQNISVCLLNTEIGLSLFPRLRDSPPAPRGESCNLGKRL